VEERRAASPVWSSFVDVNGALDDDHALRANSATAAKR
jgi:hypothetical protein